MKNIFFSVITTLFFVFFNINNSYGQQINTKIQEVYGSQTQELVVNDPEKLALLNDLLDNRIKIIESPIIEQKKQVLLSSMPLLNKYNPDLKRDEVFDPATFNVLKYNLNFFSTKTEVYRIDNTNYIIVIKPQLSK